MIGRKSSSVGCCVRQMKKLLGIWRAATGAERVVAIVAILALLSTGAFAAAAMLERPGDISNPDATFDVSKGVGKKSKPPVDRTVDWPRFGYDNGRSKFLDAQGVRPPYRKLWKYDGGELIEFPPIVVDGRLYFIDNAGLYVALDAETRQGDLEGAPLVAERILARLRRRRPLQRQPRAGPGARRPGARRQGPLEASARRPGRVVADGRPRSPLLRRRIRDPPRAQDQGRQDGLGDRASGARSRRRRP